MLKTNQIPQKEPLLRVGIILPEDAKKQVTLVLPSDRIYTVTSETSTQVKISEKVIDFSLDHNLIHFMANPAKSWIIKSSEEDDVQPNSGIMVKNIIAGRGFHWQKPIDIVVSGSVEIRVFDEQLILINELPLEAYLMCVATSEMGSQCPPALIESQTIAARSWMLANIEQKHVKMGMDVCNDDCCQRYQGNTNLTAQSIQGALNTHGQVLLYKNKICDARYSKSCGGKMETFKHLWPGPDLPYLRSIPDAGEDFEHPALALSDETEVKLWINDTPATYCSPKYISESSLKKYLGSVDEKGNYFRWRVDYTQQEITALLNQKLNLEAKGIYRFVPFKRGGSGRIISLKIIFIDKHGQKASCLLEGEYQIRQAMHRGFLYSSCFYIQSEPESDLLPEMIIIHGAGWGHGAGYCQIGALGMSLAGYSTEEILAHYYPGSRLKKIYE